MPLLPVGIRPVKNLRESFHSGILSLAPFHDHAPIFNRTDNRPKLAGYFGKLPQSGEAKDARLGQFSADSGQDSDRGMEVRFLVFAFFLSAVTCHLLLASPTTFR